MSEALALLSSVFYGVSDFAGGFASRRVSPFAVTAYAALVAGIFFGIGFLFSSDATITGADAVTGVVAGVALLFGNVLYFMALARGNMGVVGGVLTLMVLVPMAYDALHDSLPSALALLGIVVMVGGVVLLGAPEMKGGAARTAVLLALVAALMYGLSQLAINRASDGNSMGMRLVCETTVVVLLAIVGLVKRSNGGMTRAVLPVVVVVGAASAVALSCYSWAAVNGNASVISVLASLAPVVIAALAYVFLKERLVRIQVAALGVVILGVVLIGAGS
jgi:drug/metabolite transporter (DMT)-like permease